MIKEFAWNAFIKSGVLESYLFYREIEERNRTEENSNTQVEELTTKQA